MPSRLAGALLIAAALAVKLIVFAQLNAHPLLQPRGDLDATYYVELAERVAGGDINLGGEPFFVSPLYAYFLGAVFAVCGGKSLFAAQLVQMMGGVLAVCLIAWTARRWYGAAAGWIAGALAIGTGVFTFNEIAILQSSIDPLLTSLWLAALTAALTSPPSASRLGWWTMTGALIGLHALNRPNVLVCGAVLIVIVALIWRTRTGLMRAAACAAGITLIIGAVVIRNTASFGEPLLITAHGGLNFFIGNNADADGTYSAVEGITPSIRGQVRDARRVAEAAAGHTLSEGEVSGYFYDRAFDWIASHPMRALTLFARKVAYTLNATDLALNHSYTYFSRDESSLLRVLILGPWCLVPLGLLGLAASLMPAAGRGLLRPGVTARDFLPWAAMTPALTLGVALFFVSGRYRLPLLTPFVIAAAPVLVWTWRVIRNRGGAAIEKKRTRKATATNTPSTGAATGGAVNREATTKGAATSTAAHGGAVDRVPRHEDVGLGLGAGLALSLAFLVFAVLANWRWGLDDGRAGARTEMAVASIEAGDDARAEQLIALAAADHPTPGLLHYLTARAWHARGALDRAIAAYQRALAADPDQPEIAFNLGEALIANGALREATPHLRLACNRGIRPDRCPALLVKALADSGAADEAARWLAAYQPPRDLTASALSSLGSLALSVRQLDRAESWLRAALAQAPDDAAALEQYGLVLMLQERPKDAVTAFERATRLDPASASAAYNLAVAHLGIDDRAAALRWLDEALRRQPTYEAAQRLRAQVAGTAH
jgi:Tfp pilus assembly protein PilF/4-amino-4-deoxy-L-arabinose transferase-like glycosyltransferase